MKLKVYQVDDPDVGEVYYHEKEIALQHARTAKAPIIELNIDDKKFPNAVTLWTCLLNRENFAAWTKDISKEV